MHILHLIDSLGIGGAERMLVDIANASVKAKKRLSVCISRSSDASLLPELDATIESLILNRSSTFDFQAMASFVQFLKARQVDIIHAHGRSSFSFALFVKTLYRLKQPLILHDHYGAIEIDRSVPLWFRFWGKARLAAYIGVYQKLGDWALAAGVAPKKVFVIGNGINPERLQRGQRLALRENLGLKASTRLGLVVAGIRAEKGIDLLIEALAHCPNFDMKILIAGGERDPLYSQSCRELAEKRNVSQYLQFLGERKDIPELMNSVDFGLMPSRSESGPLVLIEYMLAKLPFVSFCVGDIANTAFENKVEGIVEAENPRAFAAALSTLLELSETARQERGVLGQKVAQRVFSIEAKLPQFLQVYESLKAQH